MRLKGLFKRLFGECMPRRNTKRKFDSGPLSGFAEVLENLEEAIFIVRVADRCILGCNEAAEKLFGYDRDSLAGQPTSVLHIDEEHHENFGRMSEKAISREGVYNGNFMMRRKDGSIFSSCHRIILVSSDAGEVLAVSFVTPLAETINVDETNLLRSILDAQLPENASFKELMSTLLKTICNVFEWDYGEVWSIGHHGQLQIDQHYPSNDESLEEFVRASSIIRFPPGEGLVGKVFKEGKPEFHDQGAWSPGKLFRRTLIARRAGLVTFYGVPILMDQEAVAVVLLAHRSKKEISAAITTTLLDTLSWIGTEPKFSDAMSSISNLIEKPSVHVKRSASAIYQGVLPSIVYDNTTFEIVDYNERTSLLTEYFSKDLIGKQLQDVFELDAQSFDVTHRQSHKRNGLCLICDDNKDGDSALTGGCLLSHPIIWNGETVLAGFYMNRQILEQIDETDATSELFMSARSIIRLTLREREVFSHLLALRSSKAVANVLDISHRTVEVHRASIIRYFEADSFSTVERRLVGLFFDTE